MAKRFDRTKFRRLPRYIRIEGIDAMGSNYKIIATPEGLLEDGRRTKEQKYPFAQLEIGQSFVIPAKEANEGGTIDAANRFAKFKTRCQYYGRTLGRKFRCAKRDDGAILVGRVE